MFFFFLQPLQILSHLSVFHSIVLRARLASLSSHAANIAALSSRPRVWHYATTHGITVVVIGPSLIACHIRALAHTPPACIYVCYYLKYSNLSKAYTLRAFGRLLIYPPLLPPSQNRFGISECTYVTQTHTYSLKCVTMPRDSYMCCRRVERAHKVCFVREKERRVWCVYIYVCARVAPTYKYEDWRILLRNVCYGWSDYFWVLYIYIYIYMGCRIFTVGGLYFLREYTSWVYWWFGKQVEDNFKILKFTLQNIVNI